MKKSQNEIKSLLEAVESRYFERIHMMEKSQELFEKKIGEVKNLYDVIDDVRKRTELIGKDNEKVQSEVKRLSNNTNDLYMSYADVIKSDKRAKAVPELKSDVAIIVKPKLKQSAEKTKRDLIAKVDPKSLKITNVETKNNGVMIIQSENNCERDKIKVAIEKNIGSEYDIKAPDPLRPSFTVSRMTLKYDQIELVELLKKQNTFLSQTSLKVVKQFEIKKNNNSYYNAIVEIDKEDFTKVLAAESLNIGWERCKVFDAVNVLICHKCKGFNHKFADCKNDEACQKCHGKHNAKICNENPINKCLNCIRANSNFHMSLEINHDTYDKHCPCYINKLQIRKKKLGY